MADILIRGMKMPKGKDAITLAITSDGEVLFVEFDRTIDGGIILSHADIHPVKAIEVPDHGRLIDANKMEAVMEKTCAKCMDYCIETDGIYADCNNCIWNEGIRELLKLPYVIPASGKEDEL